MPVVPAVTTPADPYKNFKFLVLWDKRPVAAVSKVGALKRTTQVVTHRDGGLPSTTRKSPGQSQFDAIILERGITTDTAFEQWANAVWSYGHSLGSESYLANFRKTVTIELYNDAGQPVQRYFIYRAWVSEYQAMPDLDANANAIAIQTLKIENEGWQRDTTLQPAAEPSFAFQA